MGGVTSPFLTGFVICVDGPARVGGSIPVNTGDEIVLYAKFIVDNYDHLPSRMIFGHGHERAWHQRVRCSV